MPGQISRSTGYDPGIPTMGMRPGGGYSGSTEELDRSVQEDAKWLADAFPGFDVEIRFNSDRQSGGAFLQGLGDPYGTRAAAGWRGVMAEVSVGLNTGIVSQGAADWRREHPIAGEASVMTRPGELYHGVVLEDVLSISGETELERRFSTAAEARDWLLQNVDFSKITRKAVKAKRKTGGKK